ncbi:MAG: GNAT family N-acetyltransferase [Anaerolineales bacterium]|nr:GNAT family N-acetyltransferase [Anaerolineales bacterium]
MMITLLEELSANALPALQTVLWDGWLLRFANGYTGRANSVWPLYIGTRPFAEKIEHSEQLYRARGLTPAFKLTAAAHPSGLDDALAAHGYAHQKETLVQTLTLSTQFQPHGTITPHPTEAWFTAFTQLSGLAPQHQPTLRQILGNLVPAAGFALIEKDGQAVACGMGVVQAGYVGLYDIVTHADFRRQGYGEQLVSGLLAWAQTHGAHSAYLQVMANNPAALSLYGKFGFQESYRYWYRIKAE